MVKSASIYDTGNFKLYYIQMQDFLKHFKEYARLPEMKVFWPFLFLVILIMVIDYMYLSLSWSIVNAMIFISVGIIMFAINVRSAKTKVQLANEKQRVDNIIFSMNDGVMVYDQDFTIKLFNKAAEGIFGISEKEIIGQKISPESAKEPNLGVLTRVIFQSLAPQIIRRSNEGEYPQVADISFDEPHLELRVSTDRMMNESGEITGFLKIVRDRTREVDLVRAKSDFITVAAHQLRTPLSAVNWVLQSLRGENLDVNEKDLVNTGLSASGNLQKIVEDLLNVAKIEEGKFGYNFQKTDLIGFFQSLIEQARPVAKEYNVKVYMELPQEQAMEADIDAERMSLVTANLLENAIKYNVQNGQVVLSIERQTDAPYFLVKVSDTGMGMSQETLDKLFTKFFRGENAVNKEANGSGLGLYMVKNIIRRHGGKIWAESNLNRGTTFYFTIPTDASLIPQREITEAD